MKKAELQIQESILAIFIFFVILGISLIFFYQYQNSSIKSDMLRYEQTRYYELLANIPNMPELRCSSLTDEQDCIDTLKLVYFNPKEHDFGEKSIKISLLNQSKTALCSQSNYPDCNIYLVYNKANSGLIITSPVSLYYPLTNEYKPGLLEIKWQA